MRSSCILKGLSSLSFSFSLFCHFPRVRKKKSHVTVRRKREDVTVTERKQLAKDAERLTSCCGCVLHTYTLCGHGVLLMRFAAPRKKREAWFECRSLQGTSEWQNVRERWANANRWTESSSVSYDFSDIRRIIFSFFQGAQQFYFASCFLVYIPDPRRWRTHLYLSVNENLCFRCINPWSSITLHSEQLNKELLP